MMSLEERTWLDLNTEDMTPYVYRCDTCGEVIEEGAYAYDMGGYFLCEECAHEWLEDQRKEVWYE